MNTNNKSKVKQAHYVPSSYLELFADKNNKLFVYDYDKKEYRVNQSPQKLLKCKYFYDLSSDELEFFSNHGYSFDVQAIESMLSQNIEDTQKKVIEQIMNIPDEYFQTQTYIKNEELKEILSYLVVYQLLRTRNARCFFSELSNDEMYGAFMQKLALMSDKPIKQLANYIQLQSWTIIYNKTNKPYITSDTPVALQGDDATYGMQAINKKEIIMFPLTPNLLLQILSVDYTKHENTDRIDISYVDDADNDFINFPNSLQMENAQAYVISGYDYKEEYYRDKQAGYTKQASYEEISDRLLKSEQNISYIPEVTSLLLKLENQNISEAEKKSSIERLLEIMQCLQTK